MPPADSALFPVPDGARQYARRVVLLTGPSGSGKSSLSRRLGLPVVALDDFYHDVDAPGLPQRFGSVDWDAAGSWNHGAAAQALVTLCRDGDVEVPIYDIPTSRRTGTTTVVAGDSPIVLAEGIFAGELVDALRAEGVLADAVCLVRPRVHTFWLRLLRDLAESRKRPSILIRRGLAHYRSEPAKVRAWVAQGCRATTPARAEADVRALLT
ncbi:uridine kinase family protein [Ruania halotolerans]|uniref:uridine kinase family protein n=1 Tax=Ruania halotolerans TaxID=2897773 RepID=UPI001E57BAD4|nr:ATP-binding protein [Ruania halotolerans]UFU05897.1 ATP-binding protein [Ruania halotolerans]